MRYGSLFSGMGGLDLAVEEVFGAKAAWHAEIEPAPCRVLERRWPGVPNLGDVSKVDWAKVEPVELMCGGFPCTDLSPAGRQAGLKPGTRSGLWSEFARAIKALRPELVVIENVRGLLSTVAGHPAHQLGFCPGCLGDDPERVVLRALGAVLGDLADLGFDAEWTGLPASGVGAPHPRFRIVILAWPASDTSGEGPRRPRRAEPERELGFFDAAERGSATQDTISESREQRWPAAPGQAEVGRARADTGGRGGIPTTDPYGDGREGGTEQDGEPFVSEARYERQRNDADGLAVGDRWGDYGPAIARWEAILGRPAPAPSIVGAKGQPKLSPVFVEWLMGLPAGWVTDVGVSTNEALKMLGNGVVPQQAEAGIRYLLERARMA